MMRSLIGLAAAAGLATGAVLATGSQWVIQSTPNRAVPSNVLQGVSCTSGSACTAVGSSGSLVVSLTRGGAKPVTTTLAERWDGTHWRIEPTPNPTGSSFSTLTGVSCSARRACTAVGSAVAGKITAPLAERWNGSRWSIEPTPRLPKGSSGQLEAVSCPASNECIAVGSYGTASNVFSGFAERWNGSRWTLAGAFRPGTGAFLAAVSCPSARLCTAVGGYESNKTAVPLAERWSAGQWRRQAAPGKGSLFGVSCAVSSQCVAVGSQPTAQPGDSVALAMRWSGGKWKRQATPALTGSTAGFLLGVSCPTVNSCTAAGWVRLTTNQTIVGNWNGTRWTVDLTPNPSGALGSSFSGIWCGAHIACRAAGSYDLTAKFNTLVERG